MLKVHISFAAFLVCLLCFRAESFPHSHEGEDTKAFRLPAVPDTLTAQEARIAYLSLHYWDHFDFSDTSLISRPEITEQAFVDFVSILPYTPNAQEAVDMLFCRTLAEKEMFSHFVALADKYLYEPDSPMHDEELHILVLRALVDNPHVEEADKLRSRHLLEMAQKNRPGNIATDFAVTCRGGKRIFLSGIEAGYTLLYFNDPDCGDCRRVKEQLVCSATINRLLESGCLRLLSVCVEDKTTAWEQAALPDSWIDGYDDGQRLIIEQMYDFKMMPALYLLDDCKRVILKDASVGQIETWLSENALLQKTDRRPR